MGQTMCTWDLPLRPRHMPMPARRPTGPESGSNPGRGILGRMDARMPGLAHASLWNGPRMSFNRRNCTPAPPSPREGKCMPACEYRTPAVGAVAAGSDGSDVPSVRRVRGRRGQRMPRGGVPLRHGPAILVVCHPRRAPHACAFTVEADTGEMRGGLNA